MECHATVFLQSTVREKGKLIKPKAMGFLIGQDTVILIRNALKKKKNRPTESN